MKIKKENTVLALLIRKLSRDKNPIWQRVASELAKPRRKKVEVNLSKIEQYAKPGATVLIPGKVLGSGNLTKKIKIAAFDFSESARKLITANGSQALSIEELMALNPEGNGVILIK